MKTTLTLFFSFLLCSAFAQYDAQRDDARRVILGERRDESSKRNDGRDVIVRDDNRTVYNDWNNRYPDRYQTYGTSRERTVYQINRAYNEKIDAIQYSRAFSRREKERIIRQLEIARRHELAELANRDYERYKEYKRLKDYNNGNHYGWGNGRY